MTADYLEYEHICYPRFEDMDSYGVLHHSRFLLLAEEAKLAFMQDEAFFGRDILNEECKFFISELHMNYVRAIRYKTGVPAVINLRFSIKEEMKIVFDFSIYYENRLSCRGSAVHIAADNGNRLKLELPDGLVRRYEELTGAK